MQSTSNTGQNHDDPLTWSRQEFARVLGISLRHLDRLISQERVPKPLRLGRRVLFPVADAKAWLAAGSLTRDKQERTVADPAAAG